MAALGRIASKKVDCLGPDQWIKAIQGFVENEYAWIVCQCLGQADTLSHPLAVAGDLAPGSITEADLFDDLVGESFTLCV